MANYAEELAYWYLRLNGFFLIENFVIHRTENRVEHRGDTDLLAIRLPGVMETIGNMPVDFDDAILFRFFARKKLVGLIVEVKSATTEPIRPNICFKPEKMIYALNRLGFELTEKEKECLGRSREWIRSESIIGDKPFQIGKLLIHNNEQDMEINYAAPIRLADIGGFIKDRFVQYKKEKWGSRTFFPSSLIQYIIDEVTKSSLDD
jgi:hypothetical protein